MEKKVFLALSGGVDSSVAALLLLKRGYDVFPVFLKCWSEQSMNLPSPILNCPWEEDLKFALAVCEKLGIENKFQTWNFEKEFFENVITYYIEEQKKGKTPNPDIVCNQKIKFGIFFNLAMEQGADFVATGHYARIKKTRSGFLLLRAKCESKNDQTYFLYRISQKQLSKTLFPIGEFESKEKVRQLAEKFCLPTAQRKSTRGICFVGKENQKKILFNFIPPHPGPIMTPDGKIVGEHLGVEFYTLGQRTGIGLWGGQKQRLYVIEKDFKKNILIVGEASLLFKKEVFVGNLHWILEEPKFPVKCSTFLRHPQEKTVSTHLFKIKNNLIKVIFKKPQWAPTPGQSIVFYQGQKVLGGGIIIDYQ